MNFIFRALDVMGTAGGLLVFVYILLSLLHDADVAWIKARMRRACGRRGWAYKFLGERNGTVMFAINEKQFLLRAKYLFLFVPVYRALDGNAAALGGEKASKAL